MGNILVPSSDRLVDLIEGKRAYSGSFRMASDSLAQGDQIAGHRATHRPRSFGHSFQWAFARGSRTLLEPLFRVWRLGGVRVCYFHANRTLLIQGISVAPATRPPVHLSTCPTLPCSCRGMNILLVPHYETNNRRNAVEIVSAHHGDYLKFPCLNGERGTVGVSCVLNFRSVVC